LQYPPFLSIVMAIYTLLNYFFSYFMINLLMNMSCSIQLEKILFIWYSLFTPACTKNTFNGMLITNKLSTTTTLSWCFFLRRAFTKGIFFLFCLNRVRIDIWYTCLRHWIANSCQCILNLCFLNENPTDAILKPILILQEIIIELFVPTFVSYLFRHMSDEHWKHKFAIKDWIDMKNKCILFSIKYYQYSPQQY